MNKMNRHATRTTTDGRSQVSDVTQFLMTSLKLVRKRRKQLHARDVRGLVAFCFCPLEEKFVNKWSFPSICKMQTVFPPISRPDKHAGLLKIYFKPTVEKFKVSTLVG